MTRKPPSPFPFPPKRLYMGATIPMRVIRRYARAIAEEFHPDRIILFHFFVPAFLAGGHFGPPPDLLPRLPSESRVSTHRHVGSLPRLTMIFGQEYTLCMGNLYAVAGA